MGRKLLIMPPYQPVEYHGDIGREIERRSEMYRNPDMRSAPYRGGGYNDRAGVMTYGGGSEMRYYDDMEERYRDSWGRYARGEDDMMVEDRQYRDSRGRYTSRPRSEYMGAYNRIGGPRTDMPYDGGMEYGEMNHMTPYVQPVYERRREEYKPMNKIGFAVGGEMEHLPREAGQEYRTSADYPRMDEMASRTSERMSGYGSGSEYMPMTKQMAMEWAKNLENEDGSRGPHWNMDQTNTVMAQKHIEADPVEFFLAMNLTYSDLCKEFKKHGINNMEAYVDFAKAFWLNDQDVGEDKIAKYYQMVAR